jgi:retinol dehydrogenase 12
MMQLLLIRELAARSTASSKPGNVVISIINPGYVNTSIMREAGAALKAFMAVILKPLSARTAEEGGRTLVFAAYGGEETHGRYLDDCKVGM